MRLQNESNSRLNFAEVSVGTANSFYKAHLARAGVRTFAFFRSLACRGYAAKFNEENRCDDESDSTVVQRESEREPIYAILQSSRAHMDDSFVGDPANLNITP